MGGGEFVNDRAEEGVFISDIKWAVIETVGGSVEGEGGLIGFLVGDDGFDVASGGARTPDGEFFADIDGTFGEEFTGVDSGNCVIGIINE